MDRDTARTLGLAVLAVLALAAAAATVDTAVTDGGGFGVGGGSGGGPGVASSTNATAPSEGPASARGPLFEPICIPWLARPLTALVLLGAFAAANYAAYRLTGSVLLPLAFGVALGLPALVVYAVLTACGAPPAAARPSAPSGEFPFPLPSGGGGLGAGSGSSPTAALFALLLVAAVVGAALLLFLSTGDDDSDTSDDDDAPAAPAADVDAVGRAAGAAADRIEADADVENEVFRAWREMTDSLDVANPSSSTPAEFAAAAVDAGMDADDVRELTSLFEAVRYGGATPTAERERRAVEALRRIEATYADDDADRSWGDAP